MLHWLSDHWLAIILVWCAAVACICAFFAAGARADDVFRQIDPED